MDFVNFPAQAISYKRKNKAWRKQILDFADSKSFFNYPLCRKSTIHKKINYDLLDGKLHMEDLKLIINPDLISAGFIPNNIQHYPIMNSKLSVLRGEEAKRVFDFKVIITNPNSISEIENNKKELLLHRLQAWVANTTLSEDDANLELEKISDYFTYEWLDMREIRANALINHYIKELNLGLIFNLGFMDAMAVGEEIYQVDIVGGEPTVERLNPLKVRVLRSGYSNRIEDADMIILEDYWSPGKIIDTYYDVLSKSDMEYIEKMPNAALPTDSMLNIDDRAGYINVGFFGEEGVAIDAKSAQIAGMFGSYDLSSNSAPFDFIGNIKVLRVYWKSRRKIKKVKSYDPLTGEELFNFYPETYVINKDMGEEELVLFINEAWEGVKIGKNIYVNMRPRIVLYNRLSNPSRCHFGIIGSIYNLNENKPFSMVDMMKSYSYLYDVIHDRLNKLIARNWGNLVRMDFSKKPKGWDVEKVLYYAKTMGLWVEDSFNEGLIGAATGKLAGAMNSASTGVIPASDANAIKGYMELLEFIKNEMSEVAGISKLREGLISNRETVGGVERATLQSSHITEYLFFVHDDIKRRVIECLLETAKIALRGKTKKFLYLLSDGALKIVEIDGDEFAESDYGLVVDNSNGTQELNLKLDTLAQAALQNLKLSFSTIMKLYASTSLIEKQRMVENDEKRIEEQQLQQFQLLLEQLQLLIEQLALIEQAKMELEYKISQEDNETKIIVAEINSQAEAARLALMAGDTEGLNAIKRDELNLKVKEFEEKLKLDKEKLKTELEKIKRDLELKARQIAKSKSTSK